MNGRQMKALSIAKVTASSLFLLGLIALISSFFTANGASDYAMHAGLGMMVGACFLFAGGLIVALLDRDIEQTQ